MIDLLKRRQVLAGMSSLLAVAPLAGAALAQTPVQLRWDNLLPANDGGISFDELREIGQVDLGTNETGFLQAEASGFTDAYSGQLVSLPGFMVPLDHRGFQVTEFILVPFAGACIHTPPPPANQMVFVTLGEPADFVGLYDAVEVTGIFDTMAMSTVVGEIGYTIEAGDVKHWRG